MFLRIQSCSEPGLCAGPCHGGAEGGGEVWGGGHGDLHQECPHGLQSQVFSGQNMEQVQEEVCQEFLLRVEIIHFIL
jgi:hypothetical protein